MQVNIPVLHVYSSDAVIPSIRSFFDPKVPNQYNVNPFGPEQQGGAKVRCTSWPIHWTSRQFLLIRLVPCAAAEMIYFGGSFAALALSFAVLEFFQLPRMLVLLLLPVVVPVFFMAADAVKDRLVWKLAVWLLR